MVNKRTLFFFTILSITGIVLLVMGFFVLAGVSLLFTSFYFIYISFKFHSKVSLLSNKYFANEKLNNFSALRQIDLKLVESEEKFKLISQAIENIGNEIVDDSIQLNGIVGAAIENLQTKLTKLKEEEAKRTWAVQGMAQIGEIRKNEENLVEYSFQVISQLVKYLGGNQGSFYIIEGEKPEDYVLKLLSTYAYNKRKHAASSVEISAGQGLLGQSILEKDMIFLTEVPPNYIRITSGLGEATPRCIVIMPLIFRESIYGAFEIASFKVLEKYQLDFLARVSEGIAAEISVIKTHEHTRNLLSSSENLAIELQSREEEMRQSMEELGATQEEMARKMIELEKLQRVDLERKKNEAILNGCMDGVISFNDLGQIEFVNTAAEEIFGFRHDELIEKRISDLLPVRAANSAGGEVKVITKTGSEVKIRTEVSASDAKGEEISLLLTATIVDVEGRNIFTLFIQKISVDLF